MDLSQLATRIGRRMRHTLVHLRSVSIVGDFRSCLDGPENEFLARFALPAPSKPCSSGVGTFSREVLLGHFRNRPDSSWPPWPERLSKIYEQPAKQSLAEAEAVLARRFSIGDEIEVCFDGRIDWRHNPTPDPRARWTRELNRHRWLGVLVRAYEQTGEPRYAKAFRELISDWIVSNRPPGRKNESDPIWTLMGVGMRAVAWTTAFGVFRGAPQFGGDSQMLFLRSIADHAEFLARYRTHLNHLLREANGLETLGVYFPEFQRAPIWRETARTRLMDAAERQVNDDGVHVELSTGYQWLVAEELLAAQHLLTQDPDAAEGAARCFGSRVESLFEALAYLARPDSTWPQLNDGFMEAASGLRQKLAQAANHFQRSDLLFVASQGQQGKEPPDSSRAFPHAGLVVMRSGWDREANYLIFDAGPLGGPHGHEDALSIEVHSAGYPFVVDPGCSTYHAEDPFRDYFVSSRAHSTVLVNGLGQVRRWDPRNMDAQFPGAKLGHCHLSDVLDYAAGEYVGPYGAFRFRRPSGALEISGVRHRREVVFVKPDYWIIIDGIAGSRNRTLTQLFQLHPAVHASQLGGGTGGYRLKVGALSDLLLIPLSADRRSLSQRVAVGEEDPLAGWYSDGRRNHLAPAPSVSFEWPASVEESALFATLLLPVTTDWEPNGSETFEWLTATVPGENVFHIRSDHGEDLISILGKGTQRTLFGITMHGLVSGVRRAPDGSARPLFDWMP